MATAEALIKQDLDEAEMELQQRRSRRRLWQTIGASKLADRLSSALASQTIRALGQIRDNKEYLSEGFQTFEDFLDQDPESPMTYDQFNRREKLLDSEGDLAFDLLSSLDVPLKTRKLLAGQIEVNGNDLRIGDAHVSLDNETAILNLITTQHAKLLEQQRTIDRGRKDIETQKRRVVEAEKRASVAGGVATSEGSQRVMFMAGACAECLAWFENISEEEQAAHEEQIAEILRVHQLKFSVARGRVKQDEIPSDIDSDFDDLAD